MRDDGAARRSDIANRLATAAELVTEPGWEGVAEGVINGAAERLARLDFDEFQLRFETASERLYLAGALMDSEFTKASALCLIDNLFTDSFDPLGFSETNDERIARIEALRRWEAGE